MWFDGWDSVLRTILTAVAGYATLVVMLRVTGKRTLSKMNAFDFIVTIAIGSILASLILLADVTFTDGLAALATLLVLQYAVAWLAVRVQWFEDLIKAEPRLVAHSGTFLREAMRRERVTEREIHAAVREAGYTCLSAIDAVILETDGTFSVITKADATDSRSALAAVQGFDASAGG